jgi:hypothetical protein
MPRMATNAFICHSCSKSSHLTVMPSESGERIRTGFIRSFTEKPRRSSLKECGYSDVYCVSLITGAH